MAPKQVTAPKAPAAKAPTPRAPVAEATGQKLRSGTTLEAPAQKPVVAKPKPATTAEEEDKTDQPTENTVTRLAPGGTIQPKAVVLSEVTATGTEGPEMVTQGDKMGMATRDQMAYPNHADDPNPLPPNSTKAEQAALRKEVTEYTTAILSAYTRTKMRGKILWEDFITAFRPHSIKMWTRPMMIQWKDLLTSRGIYIDQDRTRPSSESIIDLLYRDKHIARGPAEETENVEEKTGSVPKEKNNDEASNGRDTQGHNDVDNLPCKDPTGDNTVDLENGRESSKTRESGNPDDDGDSSSSDEEDDKKPEKKDDPTYDDPGYSPKWSTSTRTNNADPEKGRNGKDEKVSDRGRGVTTIVKAFAGQPTFSGEYDDDLETIAENYVETALSCDATPDETRKAMFAMLTGNARTLYNRKGKHCKTFEEGIEFLKTWYNSSDKQTRLLGDWHKLSLSTAMGDKPDESEITVFRSFVSKMMSLQHQLHPDYRTDRYLRDRLLTAVDMPQLQDTLKERTPRTAHQLVNRIANRLSDRKGSSAANCAHFADGDNYEQDQGRMDADAMYTLGQRYDGEA